LSTMQLEYRDPIALSLTAIRPYANHDSEWPKARPLFNWLMKLLGSKMQLVAALRFKV